MKTFFLIYLFHAFSRKIQLIDYSHDHATEATFMHTRPFLLGAFALGLVFSLSACRQANQTTPAPKVSLVASGQTQQPRVWYGVTGQAAQPKSTTKPAYLVVVQNRTATTYMLPTGKQALTMKHFDQLSTNRVIDLARAKDHQAYTQGVKSQQATLASRIKVPRAKSMP